MTEDRAEQIVAALEAFINAKIRANEDPANYGDVAFFARQELFAILAAPKEQP